MENHFTVSGECEDGDSLYTRAVAEKPEMILSDLKMPGASILDTASELKAVEPAVKILVLTAYDDHEDIYKAMQAGIDGYIMKDTNPEQIVSTLDMVRKGFTCFQPKVNLKAAYTETVPADVSGLTAREWDVYACLVNNKSNQEIADNLFISEPTVKTHVSSILRKTGQPNRAQAVVYALQQGWFAAEVKKYANAFD
ncbi:LuxR C-terminal-related transcriptional regulator [Salisediminibacterium halotolerans]|uniref:LuxR C-terminal-related transcriptional regulator n=1 Tax=Salisediminibacterium halotolerans TaxID=517425 RepID=UPI001F5506E0|nr:response regulator transcription factor [Salisediminibacterium halotolerans]